MGTEFIRSLSFIDSLMHSLTVAGGYCYSLCGLGFMKEVSLRQIGRKVFQAKGMAGTKAMRQKHV